MGTNMSGYVHTSPAEAVAALLAAVTSVATERTSLDDAAGRVLAEEVCTPRPSPACDVSSMDGYALRIADVRAGVVPVDGEARIGREPTHVSPGAATRIVTGAPLPGGAELVIKREDVVEHADRIEIPATVAQKVKHGDFVRRTGENAAAGQVVLSPGVVLHAPRVAALASMGMSEPRVYRKVRAGIVVTGDELLPVNATPTAWELHDSNGPSLRALLSSMPMVETLSAQHATDDLEQTVSVLRAVAERSDVLFITGGVSMGNRDFVPAALQRLHARVLFHKLPQRPGKPILAAILPSGAPVLALPGNPVSVLVTARRIGVPVVRKLAGIAAPIDVPREVMIEHADDKRVDLWWHRPARLTGSSAVSLVANMGSGDVVGVAGSDGFVEIPPGETAGAAMRKFYAWEA